MKSKIVGLTLVCFTLTICILAGCIGNQDAGKQNSVIGNKSQGATSASINERSHQISLNDVFLEVTEDSIEKYGSAFPLKIFSITGLKPDNEGRSDTWIITGVQGNKSEYIEYRNNTIKINSWYGKNPNDEISLSEIIPPDVLINKHQSRLNEYRAAGWDMGSIDLRSGVFNLTLIKGSEQKIFTFNAKSGEFIGWS